MSPMGRAWKVSDETLLQQLSITTVVVFNSSCSDDGYVGKPRQKRTVRAKHVRFRCCGDDYLVAMIVQLSLGKKGK